MNAHPLDTHSLVGCCRSALLGLIAVAASLTGCSLDESAGSRRTQGPAATTTGGDPINTGAGTTTSGGTGTSGSGTGAGTTGTATGGGSSTTGNASGGTGAGSGGSGGGGAGMGSGGSGAGAGAGGAGPGSGMPVDAGAGGGPAADASRPPGLPPGAEKILGIEFFQRIAGKWTGMNQSGPLNSAFPMTVDFAPTGPSFIFGVLQLDPQNNVAWGFNIETYGGKDVLAYRNGGFLAGAKRDSRLQLVEFDTAKGYYRFCAVKEQGIPVDGCNYIEAKYTFTAPDKMIFDVTTRPERKPHVHWEATRTETRVLADPFPATIASQGQGEAKWPPGAGL